MKKVFNIEKWINSLGVEHLPLRERVYLFDDMTNGWAKRCEGLTREEMMDLGYAVSDDWMIEIEE